MAATLTSTAFAVLQVFQKPSNNPWDYTLLTLGDSSNLKTVSQNLSIDGDIRSNGNVYINGNNISISGFAVANGEVNSDANNLSVNKKYENAEHINAPDVWNNIYNNAKIKGNEDYLAEDIKDNSVIFNNSVISENSINIDVSADNTPTQESKSEGQGKIGAFGAGFLTKVYENSSEWQSISPALFPNYNTSTDSILELGKQSYFIPIQEQSVLGIWKDYEKIPGSAITDNFNSGNVTNFIQQTKQNNAVSSIFS
jgi:hypothetical protein